jgi:hypothetical protein
MRARTIEGTENFFYIKNYTGPGIPNSFLDLTHRQLYLPPIRGIKTDSPSRHPI